MSTGKEVEAYMMFTGTLATTPSFSDTETKLSQQITLGTCGGFDKESHISTCQDITTVISEEAENG